jgi:hypothetical protein
MAKIILLQVHCYPRSLSFKMSLRRAQEGSVMKKVFVNLIFVVLFTTVVFGYAIAQGTVDPRTIELEKKMLQQQMDNTHLDAARVSKIRDKMNELERDPELYFYKKSGANTRTTTGSAVNRSNSNVGQCMGDCASEQGICISQCQGNGQCINRSAATHGRCVSRCN